MDSLQIKFAQVRDLQLQYLQWSTTGTPLLWLPGLGHTAHIFRDIAPVFAQRFQVLALSRRGHGKSEAPANHDYTPQRLADDLLEFLNVLELQDVILVGHSIAGNEMTLAASQQPERFKALVYLDAAYNRSGVLKRMQQDAEHNSNASRPQPHTLQGFREDLQAQYGCWTPALEADLQDMLIQDQGRLRLREGPSRLFAATDSHVPDYRSIRCPALAIYGLLEEKEDALTRKVMLPWQQESMAQFARECPLGQVIRWNTDHHFFLTEPQKTVQCLQDFLGTLQ
ncbi:alpha/beta fold hydrolase [Deinococcus roseus]|uniref:AB hydrolase-1 domain-containing protein n=1 Tax=Deinococcus roseus TaxID=392414 RepID=A0ABQ2CYD0_9DEIO|nr:alpha/beta hydrolase [Deinococcus roseus]GGJ29291.1 hypothetical protein GCM10008938_14300 [Deinococcus roseus]